MSSISRRIVLLSSAALAGAAFLGPAQAQDLNITIGYQTVVEPSKVAQADGAYEKATKATIDWRKFDSGADVIAAVASGSVDIGYVGSSPLAAAASRELPIQTIFVVGLIGESEALVARNGSGIEKIADLAGKKVAVPFVSTTHYSLLAALKHEGVDPKSVEILNLRPPEIAAAWERGDIDAAYVWDPALARIKQTGKVLITSGELSKKGKATFDGIAASRPWAEANPDFMARMVKVIADADASYRADAAAWGPASPQTKAIAAKIGGEPKEISEALKLYAYPSAEQQATTAWLGGKDGGAAKALKATADFLAEQKRIDAAAADYNRFVTAKYVEAALKLK